MFGISSATELEQTSNNSSGCWIVLKTLIIMSKAYLVRFSLQVIFV